MELVRRDNFISCRYAVPTLICRHYDIKEGHQDEGVSALNQVKRRIDAVAIRVSHGRTEVNRTLILHTDNTLAEIRLTLDPDCAVEQLPRHAPAKSETRPSINGSLQPGDHRIFPR